MFRGSGTAALTNRPWEAPTDGWRQARLYPDCDWIRVAAYAAADAQHSAAAGDDTERVVLTIAGRALNFSVIQENLKAIYRLLRSGLEFEHYAPDTREEIVRMWSDTCTVDELFLMLTVNARAAAKPRATHTAAQGA